MKKKSLIVVLTILIIAGIGIVLVLFGGKKTYKDLRAPDISSATVMLQPENKTVNIIEIPELEDYLNEIVIYGKSDSYKEQNGQTITFTLTMVDGSKEEIAVIGSFIVINGTGYKAKYEPCEKIINYANKLLNSNDAASKDYSSSLLIPDTYVPDGSYQLNFKCPLSDEDTKWALPIFTFSASNDSFVLGHYPNAIEGVASGSFEIDGKTLICKTDDGKQYVFTIKDAHTLVYVKQSSAEIEVPEMSYLSRSEGKTMIVDDGAAFLRLGEISAE